MRSKQYYKDSLVLNEILPFVINREFYWGYPKYMHKGQQLSSLKRVGSIKDLNYMLFRANIEHFNWNLFTSVAHYKYGVHPQNKHWFSEYIDNIDGYDFFLDIDVKSHSDMDYAILSMQSVKKVFDELNVPYYLRFSGRGFHFVIPDQFFPIDKSYNPKDSNNIYKVYIQLASYLKEECSDLIDIKGTYVSAKKIKIPYSISHYGFCEYVCTPIISDFQATNFNIMDYTVDSILKQVGSRNQKLFNSHSPDALQLLNKIGVAYSKEFSTI